MQFSFNVAIKSVMNFIMKASSIYLKMTFVISCQLDTGNFPLD